VAHGGRNQERRWRLGFFKLHRSENKLVVPCREREEEINGSGSVAIGERMVE